MANKTIADICLIENCNLPVKVKSRGWCNGHYQKWQKRGDPTITLRVFRLGEICAVAGCTTKPQAKGYCQKHYRRWKSNGDPLRVNGIRNDDEARFWQFVDKTEGLGPSGECWEWTGCKESRGYGMIWMDGRMINAHRYAYFLANGHYPEPVGRHTCDNPSCVRFDHILEGTHKDNMQDKMKRGRHRNQYGIC